MVVFQNEHCWVECCFLMLRRIKGCSLPSININKSKIIQTRRIFILDDSASSDLAMTCDCGHSLRFTPTRWRRGQTATWQGLHKGHHSTCCHGDGWWRTQEVNNNIVRSLCYFPWFFSVRTEVKKEEKEKWPKSSLKMRAVPSVTLSILPGFSPFLTSWPRPVISLSLPGRGCAGWNLCECVSGCMRRWMKALDMSMAPTTMISH